MNDSSATVVFTIFKDIGSSKNVLLTVVFAIYIASLIVNVLFILLVYIDTSLHTPMYIFLCSLILNGLCGSSAVWPNVMFMLLTDVNTSSHQGCLVQAFIIGTYGACNYAMLIVMAYDRFVSIFKPLQYHAIMTPLKVRLLLLAANLFPIILVCVQIFLTSLIPICKYSLSRLVCDNLGLSSLACGETMQSRVSNMYGLCVITIFVALPIFIVLLSYVKIIKLSLQASKTAKRKVFETCSPHIIIFVNFSLASFFCIIYNRINNRQIPREANILLAVNYILIPPLLHPIIYGIKNKEIRQSISRIRKKTVFTLSVNFG